MELYSRDIGVTTVTETAHIVDLLREEAILKAPAQWKQMILMATKFWEELKKGSAAGDPKKTVEAFQSNLMYHRQYYVSLKKFFASQQ